MKSFPKELLNEIKVIDNTFLNNFDEEFSAIIDAIVELKD